MTERETALEGALNRAINRTIIAHGDEVFIGEGYSGRESLLTYFAQEVAALRKHGADTVCQWRPYADGSRWLKPSCVPTEDSLPLLPVKLRAFKCCPYCTPPVVLVPAEGENQ